MQKRYINYMADISSFEANDKFAGLIPASLYSGFTTISNPSGLRFTLAHTDGVRTTNIDEALTPPLGIWVTNQGTVVKETAPVELAIETNAGNSQKRIDLLIGKHYHDVLDEGGIPATYEVIKGPTNSFTQPTIPEPALSTLLGYFVIPADSGSLTGVTFEKVRIPTLGGEQAALLKFINRYEKQQQFKQGDARTISTNSYELEARGVLSGLSSGNTFRISGGNTSLDLIEDAPDGTEINLFFNNETTLRGMQNNVVNGVRVGYSKGVRPIFIGYKDSQTLTVKKGQVVKLVKITSGYSYVNNSTTSGNIFGDFWKLVSVSDSPERVTDLEAALDLSNKALDLTSKALGTLVEEVNKIRLPRTIVNIDYKGTYSEDFDETGKGRRGTPYWGYAECNGNNDTPDNSYRFMLPRTFHPPSKDQNDLVPFTIGAAGGRSEVYITRTELPKVPIPIQVGTLNVIPTQSNVGNRPRRSTVVSIGEKASLGVDPNTMEEGETENLGFGGALPTMPPFRVVLQLMWIGIPA